jgi:hypothetical protein
MVALTVLGESMNLKKIPKSRNTVSLALLPRMTLLTTCPRGRTKSRSYEMKTYSNEELYKGSGDDWLCRLVQHTVSPQEIEDPEVSALWGDARLSLNKIEELINQNSGFRERQEPEERGAAADLDDSGL